jgi:hypothetical protein
MKKLVLLFFASILLTSIGYAQNRGGLTGPKAKNYKSWQHDAEKSSAVVYKVNKKRLTGPQAKNKHLIKDKSDVQYAAVSTSSRPRLTGPKAKNQKLMQPAREINLDTASDEPVQEKKSRNGSIDKDNR